MPHINLSASYFPDAIPHLVDIVVPFEVGTLHLIQFHAMGGMVMGILTSLSPNTPYATYEVGLLYHAVTRILSPLCIAHCVVTIPDYFYFEFKMTSCP